MSGPALNMRGHTTVSECTGGMCPRKIAPLSVSLPKLFKRHHTKYTSPYVNVSGRPSQVTCMCGKHDWESKRAPGGHTTPKIDRVCVGQWWQRGTLPRINERCVHVAEWKARVLMLCLVLTAALPAGQPSTFLFIPITAHFSHGISSAQSNLSPTYLACVRL